MHSQDACFPTFHIPKSVNLQNYLKASLYGGELAWYAELAPFLGQYFCLIIGGGIEKFRKCMRIIVLVISQFFVIT